MNTALFTVGMYAYSLLFDRWGNFDQLTGKYHGKWETYTDTLWVIREVQGQYVKAEALTAYAHSNKPKWFNARNFAPLTVDQLPVAMAKLQLLLERKMSRVKANADVAIADMKAETDAKAEQKAYDLSVNTVTRALVHANDNGYCSETVVALTSAGHRMPTTRLVIRATVLIPIEFDGSRDYEATRQMFGMTRGNIKALEGETISEDSVIRKLRDELSGCNASLEFSYYNSHTFPVVEEAGVTFGKPAIRPLDDVVAERPAYSANDDNDY